MRAILISFALIVSLASWSQTWAPIGAQWHYENYNFSGYRGYFHFESIKDTVVLGKNCREIYSDSDYGCIHRSQHRIFTYQSNDSVYFLNYVDSASPQYQLHFRWDAKPGDSWLMIGEGPSQLSRTRDSIIVKVASNNTILINGIQRRLVKVSYLYPDSTSSHFGTVDHIEGIGDMYYMFGTEKESGFCDIEHPSGLRCYQDSVVGLFMNIPSDSCTEIKGPYDNIGELSDDRTIVKVFPNPFTSDLNISSEFSNCQITLHNSLGTQILKRTISGKEILQLHQLSPGIYLLTVSSGQQHSTLRLIKDY